MLNHKYWRLPAMLLCICLICGLCIFSSSYKAAQHRFSAQIISSEEAASMTETNSGSLTELLFWRGEAAAADENSRSIYLSCLPEAGFEEIMQELEIESGSLRLLAVEDEYTSDIAAAQRDNHRFRLLISDEKGRYTEYGLILTPLPVFSLKGDLSVYRDRELNAYSGLCTAWYPGDGEDSHFSHKAKWYYRGQTSISWDKKSRKLSFINRGGSSRKRELPGMGEDDDWLLNAMASDDLKLREKLFQRLWNEMSADTDYNYPMSEGEYIEVLVNGEYKGLHMLQRKVENELLGLKPGELLFKGRAEYNPYSEASDGYELVTSGYNERQAEAIIRSALADGSLTRLDENNYIDLSLFVEFSGGFDNCGQKNTFYVLHSDAEEPYTSLIPWDTNISFGLLWWDSLEYHFDESLNAHYIRQEQKMMEEEYPLLMEHMAERWFELRETVLRAEHIMEVYREEADFLRSCGALERDREKWGLFYGGEDTEERFYQYVEKRLEFLDDYYSGFKA